jgi:hypothetical protein
MMKKFIVLMLCLMLTGSASAVVVYSTDFDGNPGDDPLADGYFAWTTGTTGDYTGTGHYSLHSAVNTDYDGLGYNIYAGDFTSEIHLDNYSASTGPTDDVNWEYTEFIWNTYDDNGYISLQITNWGGDMYFKALEWSNTNGWVNYVQPIVTDSVSIGSLDLRETWTDDPTPGKTGTWVFEYNLNDTGWTLWHTITSDLYEDEASALRWGQFYVAGYQNWGAPYDVVSEISVDVDYYSVVPEPVTSVLLGLGGLVLLRRRRV